MIFDSLQPTPRRSFLGQLAGTAAALAGTGCVAATAAPTVAPTPASGSSAPPSRPSASSGFDDTWTRRLTARHKSVYDSPEISEGAALDHAAAVMSGYHDAIGATDADLNVVVVIRHAAIPMALNDAMWAKYDFGIDLKLKDPTTGELAKRNPFCRVTADDAHAMIDADSSFESLRRRGAVILACNLALQARAHQIAKKMKLDFETVRQELRANLVPGAILQPNGVYAVVRAQESGCALVAASGS